MAYIYTRKFSENEMLNVTKIYFLYPHLDFFFDLRSNEEGEPFHQDMKTVKSRHQECWNENLILNEHWIMTIQIKYSKENHMHKEPNSH